MQLAFGEGQCSRVEWCLWGASFSGQIKGFVGNFYPVWMEAIEAGWICLLFFKTLLCEIFKQLLTGELSLSLSHQVLIVCATISVEYLKY